LGLATAERTSGCFEAERPEKLEPEKRHLINGNGNSNIAPAAHRRVRLRKEHFFFVVLSGLLIAATIAAVEIADRLLLGLQSHALMYPPHRTIVFPGEDGAWTVHTNWLGLRDPETHHIAKRNGIRIVAIGDSTTFGFGVNDQDAWPHLLEAELVQAEVWNLGQPGAGPLTYADIAESVVDYLRPDLILVGILQADDLKQCTARSHPTPEPLMVMAKHWLPGFSLTAARVKKHSYPLDDHPEQVISRWKELASSVVASFSPAQKQKYEKIPERTRALFVAGSLNPYLVDLAIKQPSYMADILNEDLDTKQLSACLQDALLRIRGVAKRNNARVLVMSIPSGFFTARHQVETRAALGFDVAEDSLTTRKVDDIVARVAKSAGLTFVAFTDQFRQQSLRERLFLEWDGHQSRAGNKLLSQLIAKYLAGKPNLDLSEIPP